MSIQIPYTLNCNDNVIALYITIYVKHNTDKQYNEVHRQNIKKKKKKRVRKTIIWFHLFKTVQGSTK